MKKLLIMIVVAALLLAACAPVYDGPVYSFRGHKRGDTLEDVIEKEGREPYDVGTGKAGFSLEDFYGYDGFMYFRFRDDSLNSVSVTLGDSEHEIDVEASFAQMVQNLSDIYGHPHEKFDKDGQRSAVWRHDGFSILLIVGTPYVLLSVDFEYEK